MFRLDFCSANHFVLLLILCHLVLSWNNEVNLPPDHWSYYFRNNEIAANLCSIEADCPHKAHLNKSVCWGYEDNCTISRSYLVPNCSEDSKGWSDSKLSQFNEFYNSADFGYIKKQREELKTICMPQSAKDSFLECSNYTRFCRGRNILLDFSHLLTLPEPIKYKDNVLGPGMIGGYCKLDSDLLKNMGSHKSPLQSWFAELEGFVEFDAHPIYSGKCDVIIDRPTFILKLDAPINMYHHFCDFVNLYNSFHLNGSFSRDINIVLWDTMSYYGNFEITWKAFTKHPIMNLENWKGKRVCFRDLVLPLLPRMIFGMYYNMPLVPGCQGSGLFHAFNRYLLYNLGIQQDSSTRGKIRITLLSRSTAYRNILNEFEMLEALKKIPYFKVNRVVYSHQLPFKDQLKITQNTDIFIGMHGAGLTHLLFLPDWAVVFELYNCDDENCYKDLARLRGVHYMTWEKKDKMKANDQGHHPSMGPHEKFTDYIFDIPEFMRLVVKAADYVSQHYLFKKIHESDHLPTYKEEL